MGLLVLPLDLKQGMEDGGGGRNGRVCLRDSHLTYPLLEKCGAMGTSGDAAPGIGTLDCHPITLYNNGAGSQRPPEQVMLSEMTQNRVTWKTEEST